MKQQGSFKTCVQMIKMAGLNPAGTYLQYPKTALSSRPKVLRDYVLPGSLRVSSFTTSLKPGNHDTVHSQTHNVCLTLIIC